MLCRIALVVALVSLSACSSTSDDVASPTADTAPTPVESAAAPSSEVPVSSVVAATTSTTSSTTASTTTTVPERRGSTGCGTAPAITGPAVEAPGDVPLTFTATSSERTYRLGIPRDYDSNVPAPLVLNLHGSGSNAFQASVYSDLPRRAAELGVITVTPDAIDGRWDLGPAQPDDDFLMALVADVEAQYCVDLDRVHAIGMSLGAWRASATVCRHPDVFASVVLVAEEVWPNDCAPTSVVAFHGTADGVVPYGEGADEGVVVGGPNAGLSGSRDNFANWATGAGCDGGHDEELLGTDVVRWTATGCPEDRFVELYTVQGGEHTWPGADISIGATTQTVDATDIALELFIA